MVESMSKKNKNLIITVIAAVIAATVAIIAYHCYQESQKSGLEKAAKNTVDWTSKTTDKAADKTKSLFK